MSFSDWADPDAAAAATAAAEAEDPGGGWRGACEGKKEMEAV